MIIDNRQDLTREIKITLLKRGITLSGLAAMLSRSFSNVSRSVNRSDLSINQLLEIAQAINCKLEINLLPNETNKESSSSASGNI